MSVRTVRELLDCLSQGDGTGETLIKRDWWVWTNASGDICFQHPTCPTMSAMFCCDGRDADIPEETTNDIR
jgi:hypothetical protein